MRPYTSRQEQRLKVLRSTAFLAGLKEESLVKLANASQFVTTPKGAFLFYQNDPANSLYILQSGEMSVILSSADGREMIIDELHPGECFGEVSLLIGGERTAGAQAREDCLAMEIMADDFLSVLDLEPNLVRRMLDIAMFRLFKAHKRENALAFLDAPARVARVLLDMDEKDQLGPDKGFITLSQEEVAQRTGLTRQTVAYNLGKWRNHDWILTGRGRIVILNRAALRKVLEQGIL